MDWEAIGPGGECTTVALLNAKLLFKYHVNTQISDALNLSQMCLFFTGGDSQWRGS